MFRCLFRRSLLFRIVLVLLFLGGSWKWVKHWWRRRPVAAATIVAVPIFSDDFEGSAPNPLTRGRLNPLAWKVMGTEQILQRTQWGHAPEVRRDADGTSFARLCLDTHNPRPEKPGRFYLATQMSSLDRWNLESGLEYEARLRANRLPPGLIMGFFAYGDAGVWRSTYQKTEADFEFLTHKGGRDIWTHLWDNWNPLRHGENEGELRPTFGPDWNAGEWNTYKIRWYPDRTEWICNDNLIRTETRVRPGSPMGVWFNLWAPNPDWGDAYDPAIQPARTKARNRRYFFDVDYVKVSRIGAQNPENSRDKASSEIGRGEGLKGEYFSRRDLRGRSVVRLDPRVDFNWGVYAPAPTLKRDDFSVRWEGLVEARHSETYTFSVRSDDGARLWVDGRLLIDFWRVQGPATVRRGQIALRAGARVPLRLEIFNRRSNALAQLKWSSASTPPEIVPQSQLYVAARPAPPRFSPGSRTLWRAQEVKIESPTRGALIRYTLDGSVPTTSSRPLRNGAKLRVSYTALVRAGAFVTGQVPGQTTRAFYFLDDKTPPQLAITTPAPDARAERIAPVSGVVSDGGSGVKRVDLVITRLADDLKWKEGRWVKDEWGTGAKIRGSQWSVSAALPPIKDLVPGRYQLKAVAYDGAGNARGAEQTLILGPSVTKRSGNSPS